VGEVPVRPSTPHPVRTRTRAPGVLAHAAYRPARSRPVDVEAAFPELATMRRAATRLHPRRGTPTARDSSVGGPMLWPADEPWPMCAIPHKRSSGFRYTEVMRKREILEQARRRDSRSGPTAGEIEIIDGFRRGRHAPHLADTRQQPPRTTPPAPLRGHRHAADRPTGRSPRPSAAKNSYRPPACCTPRKWSSTPTSRPLPPPCRPVSTHGRGQRTTKARSTSTTCPRPPAGRSGGYIA
jgi:hypothetical protein